MERSRSVAPWMILLGALALWISLPWIVRWAYAAPSLRTHVTVFAAAGVSMIAAGVALLRSRPSALLRWGGSLASAACGTNLLYGTLAGSIPCAGPG